jgi:CHAT domain-containing protein/Tfp pilus assembly protein PilF
MSLVTPGRACVLSLLTFFVCVSMATARADLSQDYNRMLARFNRLIADGQIREAEQVALAKLEIAKQLTDEPGIAIVALFDLARICYLDGRFTEAEQYATGAFELHQQVKHLLTDEQVYLADCLNILGLIFDEQGRYPEAESRYQRALAIRIRMHGNRSAAVADTLNNLAGVYLSQGRYSEAEIYYNRALAIRKHLFGADHRSVVDCLGNLANVYQRQVRHTEAEPLYRKCISLKEKSLGRNHPEVGNILNNLAQLCRMEGRYAEAKELNERTLDIWRRAYGNEHPDVLMSLNNLANIYRLEKDYDRAEAIYQEVFDLRQRTLGHDHPRVADTLGDLALVYNDQSRFAEAEQKLDLAIEIYRESRSSAHDLHRVVSWRGLVRWRLGRRDEALADMSLSARLAENQRGLVSGGEQERGQFFGSLFYAFEHLVMWQAELGQVAEAFSSCERGRARSLVEQMQTQGVDLLADVPAHTAQELRQRDQAAKKTVAMLEKQIEALTRQPAPSTSERERLTAARDQAREELVAVYRDTRNASPAYRLAVGSNYEPLRLQELQQWVDERQAVVLEYFVGEEASVLFVVAAGQEPRVEKLALDDHLAQQFSIEAGPLTSARLWALLHADGNDTIAQLGNVEGALAAQPRLAQLWQVLVPASVRPLLTGDRYQCVFVIPDGALASLPFEALVVETKGDQGPVYLLDVGPPLAYAPSASVLLNLSRRPATEPAPSNSLQPVLTVADVQYGEPSQTKEPLNPEFALSANSRYATAGGTLSPLPFTKTESTWVANVFKKQGQSTAALRGERATEAAVRSNVSGRKVLHFACHGLIDQRYGNFFGALALTREPAPRSPENDGFLTLPEIYELDLTDCELAILSACQTNVGLRQRGEGVYGLSRGFLVAGARRVVASNWIVDDEAAASLVSYFASGVAKAQAADAAEGTSDASSYASSLQAAKRFIRKQDKWAHPFFWASFVMIGPH